MSLRDAALVLVFDQEGIYQKKTIDAKWGFDRTVCCVKAVPEVYGDET